MTQYEDLRALEIATIDLLVAIQEGNTKLSDKIEAVSETIIRVPNWVIGINVRGVK